MYDTNMQYIGEKIRDYRKKRGMNIQDLADAINKSKATITRYEKNEIIADIYTIIEICNVLNVDINDLCRRNVTGLEKEKNGNPFTTNVLYLYYISKNGLIVSTLEIEEKEYENYVLMKNGLYGNKYKQEYLGILESNYNTAFFCLTNAINNPGLDKFQIEIDLHSLEDEQYSGIFLGISDNTHKPTARKCILTSRLEKSKEELGKIFEQLRITEIEAKDMVETKYWDMKPKKMTEYVVTI